ncbi:hypothetical protein EVAR_34515_1 [Eumeta japonica]|uniref:Uncharacterized protein n=1 Tax=Eumeta variegata TaxID=151549 RepID=A0A4C1Z284_EUMVA|nr:hypothetical protein EVAR_34515_1 [Eumeta japonica]
MDTLVHGPNKSISNITALVVDCTHPVRYNLINALTSLLAILWIFEGGKCEKSNGYVCVKAGLFACACADTLVRLPRSSSAARGGYATGGVGALSASAHGRRRAESWPRLVHPEIQTGRPVSELGPRIAEAKKWERNRMVLASSTNI